VVVEKNFWRWAAGVGHANIHASKLLRDSLHIGFDSSGIGNVQWLGQHLRGRITFANAFGRCVQFAGITRAHGHPGAFAGKLLSSCQGDATTRGSDDDAAVLQSIIHCG
jgi:hypothetical protein